jgi:hypothetical protein
MLIIIKSSEKKRRVRFPYSPRVFICIHASASVEKIFCTIFLLRISRFIISFNPAVTLLLLFFKARFNDRAVFSPKLMRRMYLIHLALMGVCLIAPMPINKNVSLSCGNYFNFDNLICCISVYFPEEYAAVEVCNPLGQRARQGAYLAVSALSTLKYVKLSIIAYVKIIF